MSLSFFFFLDLAFVIYFLICMCDCIIHRHNKDGNHYVVRREIIRSESNSTRWYLNGKASSLKAVSFYFDSLVYIYNRVNSFFYVCRYCSETGAWDL